MVQKYLIGISPIIIYLSLHFFLVTHITKRKNLGLVLLLTLTSTIVVFIFSFFEKYSFVVNIPYVYLVNALICRYLLFNKITLNLKLHKLNYPFDPSIFFSGSIWGSWDMSSSNSNKPSFLELIFSIWIFVGPFFEMSLYIQSISKS